MYIKNFGGLMIVAIVAMMMCFLSCTQDENVVPTPVEESSDEGSGSPTTRAGSDVCSGTGGTTINMTGSQMFSPGKYVISLDISQDSNWTYGFSSLTHVDSPSSSATGDVYWRVVKRKNRIWPSSDEYLVYEDCTYLTKGTVMSYGFTTSNLNQTPPPSGGLWTHVQLEIVVTGGNAMVTWTSYNKSPWS